MAAVTLIEAAKALPPREEFRSAAIEIYASATDLLAAMPFQTITGNAVRWNQQAVLPASAFRKVNGSYTATTGSFSPQIEPLVIAGGDLQVDPFITKTMGEDQRGQQERLQLIALAHNFSHKIIKGDSATTAEEFNGLQTRLTGNQLYSNGSTSGGDPLSLFNLDAAIARVDRPTHLLMCQALWRRFWQAQRAGLFGQIQLQTNQAGIQILTYGGLPILISDRNSDVNATTGFNEAGAGGGSTATSIYILSLGEGMLTGIQHALPEVRDLGEQSTPYLLTRFEWYASFALWHPRCACRMYGISNAAIVA